MNLPIEYEAKMKRLLKDEYEEYLKVYERPIKVGIRINTRKISCEEFEQISPFPIEKIPWIPNGYYCNGKDGWSKHPYYFAGLYYLQEPSAMTPASRLKAKPFERVLDLCAAPGGKATQIGADLQGKGMLVANDISNSRAKGLLKNLELMGIDNCYVTSETPEKLVNAFPEFFDKILVDAPCSGEGMFHKEPGMMKFYEEHGPEYYSKIQRELLLKATKMLKPGGILLFSTCTFDPLEDEGSISYLLSEEPVFEQIDMENYEKFSPGVAYEGVLENKCVRIWPHKMEGEGHFLTMLKKKCSDEATNEFSVSEREKRNLKGTSKKSCLLGESPKEVQEFLCQIKRDFSSGRFIFLEEQVLFVQQDVVVPDKLRYLRTGLYIGDWKKNRFEPSQAFAMALKKEEFKQAISFCPDDTRIFKYLKGETIIFEEVPFKKGYCLVCVENFPLGWAKIQNNSLKNKYYKGWRMQ